MDGLNQIGRKQQVNYQPDVDRNFSSNKIGSNKLVISTSAVNAPHRDFDYGGESSENEEHQLKYSQQQQHHHHQPLFKSKSELNRNHLSVEDSSDTGMGSITPNSSGISAANDPFKTYATIQQQ